MTLKTKQIFILIKNNGDGSSSTRFVLDPKLIVAMERADEMGLLDCEQHAGVDGDGFHYSTINVPENFTPQDLGISEGKIISPSKFLNSLEQESTSDVFANLNIT